MGSQLLCVDSRNLNLATPKDEYPMPIADLLVDLATCNSVWSLLDWMPTQDITRCQLSKKILTRLHLDALVLLVPMSGE
jgi:hypothetical protein